MTEYGCPDCGYLAVLDESAGQVPNNLQCPVCGAWINAADSHGREEAPDPIPIPPAPDVEAAAETAATTLRLSADDVAPESSFEPAVVGHLIISGTPTLEPPFPLRGHKTTVGREGADLTVDDPALSGHHFEIEHRAGGFVIRDLESTNGTLVNGQRIQIARLESGDKIRAGETGFVFRTLDTVAWTAD